MRVMLPDAIGGRSAGRVFFRGNDCLLCYDFRKADN